MKKLFFGFLIFFMASSLHSQPLESDTVDVLNYEINLNIVHLSQKTISGNAVLTVVPKVALLSRLKLDLLHLNVDSVKVNNQNRLYTYNDSLLRIDLQQSFSQLDTLTVTVFYHGQPVVDPTGWGGFYFSSDSLYAYNLGVGFGDNPHNYGRVFFPCLDDFHDRATYDFRIKTKSDKMAVCSGTLMGITTDAINATSTYYWRLHHTIPTYLAGLAVGPYVAVKDTFQGMSADIPIEIYVPANKVSAVNVSFARLHQVLEAYEWAYGPYRWERIGYVGIPFGSGAMEHATNIALGLGFIDGTSAYESLIFHELSHHWFGDLVTTNSAPEMWINEGWAVYSENLYQEILDGKELARAQMRSLLKSVIQRAHLDDGGYWSLANLPHSATYGTTAYDKGATVAHSLRGYLGDSLFFDMLHNYFSQNAFSFISNADFRDFITGTTGINMNGFFDAWIFQPGFTHFSVDSFSVHPAGNKYFVDVNMRQKLRHKAIPAAHNRVWVRFANDQWQFADRLIEFDGFSGLDTAILNFIPTKVFTDPDGVLADATTDYYEIIKNTGLKTYADALFKLDIKQLSDSALFFVTHHWVAPDTQGTNLPGLSLSTSRYWTVEGIFPPGIHASGQFNYSRFNEMDGDIILNSQDSLVILYRAAAGKPWVSINFQKNGLWSSGWLTIDNLLPGEYALAVWDEQFAGLAGQNESASFISLFPNPASEFVNINIHHNDEWQLQITDYQGNILNKYDGKGDSKLKISSSTLEHDGVYLINLIDSTGEKLESEKLIWMR